MGRGRWSVNSAATGDFRSQRPLRSAPRSRQRSSTFARIRDSKSSADAVEAPARCSIQISRSWARSWPRMRVISLRTQSSFAGLTAPTGPRARRRTSGSAWRRPYAPAHPGARPFIGIRWTANRWRAAATYSFIGTAKLNDNRSPGPVSPRCWPACRTTSGLELASSLSPWLSGHDDRAGAVAGCVHRKRRFRASQLCVRQ
jgi:hypothetical protein